MRFCTLTTFLLLLLGCQRDPVPEPVQYSVPAELEPYVQTFRTEASRRMLVVPTTNLIVQFGTPEGTDVCGQCLLATGKTPRVTISTDAVCWKNSSEAEREALLLHELGHCLLKRSHRPDRFPNGAYVSIMNADDVSLYAVCRYPIGDDICDKRPRRAYYLDELFDPATPAPAWGN